MDHIDTHRDTAHQLTAAIVIKVPPPLKEEEKKKELHLQCIYI